MHMDKVLLRLWGLVPVPLVTPNEKSCAVVAWRSHTQQARPAPGVVVGVALLSQQRN